MCEIAKEVRPADPSTNEAAEPAPKKSPAEIAAAAEAAKLQQQVDEEFKKAKMADWQRKLLKMR